MRKGRPVKLNRQTLEVQKGKDYAEIVFFGDVHLGAHTCELQKAQDMLDYCLKNHIYVLGMGDQIECGLSNSVGGGVYAQKLNPQQQMEDVIEMFRPLAEAGLLLGMHNGNHCNRIYINTGIHIMKIISGILNVPYLQDACWSLFKVGKQNYTCYSMHGTGGSRLFHTKLKRVSDVSHYFNAHIVAHAHVHQIATSMAERQYVDLRSKTIAKMKQYLILTGHYLGYFNSYAQMMGLPPSKTGSPKAKLYADKHDVDISF